MKITLLFVLAVSPCVFAECLPVTGDRILGRDLALADPQFSALPASVIVGSAPVPGSKRVFASAELFRIARANNIQLVQPKEVCFEVPLQTLVDEDFASAMRQALPAGTEVTILDRSRTDVPPGDIVFHPNGLAAAPANDPSVQLWRGFVRYTGTRKVEIWAKVRICGQFTSVMASRDLAANVPIDATALRIETWTGPLQREALAVRLEEVLGRIPKRALKAGAPIPLSLLRQAPVVRRGEAVKVDVQCGPARLHLDAIAERDGRDGEMLELRNPVSGKTFRARLEGSKAVLIIPMGQTI
jgi:flagella basal body P-ring formation protein FlgA